MELKERKIKKLIKKIKKMGGNQLNLFVNYLRLNLELINEEEFGRLLYEDLA